MYIPGFLVPCVFSKLVDGFITCSYLSILSEICSWAEERPFPLPDLPTKFGILCKKISPTDSFFAGLNEKIVVFQARHVTEVNVN